jgi:hypothetical protein
MLPFINATVPADHGQSVLPCSIMLGCTITLPAGERLQYITIGDERYTVRIASNGSDLPARILIYPSRDQDAAREAKIDIADTSHAYMVILQPTATTISQTLTFTPPVRSASSTPTPVGEITTLDPTQMTFGAWRYTGDAAISCISTFEYAATVWCKLQPNLTKAPSVYGIVGKTREPVDVRIVDRTYLVIQSIDGPFEVNITLNGIERHGKLEHS